MNLVVDLLCIAVGAEATALGVLFRAYVKQGKALSSQGESCDKRIEEVELRLTKRISEVEERYSKVQERRVDELKEVAEKTRGVVERNTDAWHDQADALRSHKQLTERLLDRLERNER